MIIPCIDLMEGRAVQLVRGERLALEERDLDALVDRFSGFELVHVIDLDAALGRGSNAEIVRDLIRARACRVGGGVRTPAVAEALLNQGALSVILGSAAYSDSDLDVRALKGFPADRTILATDFRGRKVVIHGWRKELDLTPSAVIERANDHVAGFLCTCVDSEGTMSGTDLAQFRSLRRITTKPIIAAGGIGTYDEVLALEQAGLDVALGMSIYTGRLDLGRLLGMVRQ